jgi:hypothetical protein
MDFRTAFLNGELNKEFYMDHPLGFKTKGQECKAKFASLRDPYMVLASF